MSLKEKIEKLRQAIKGIYRYECPWEIVTEPGTDLLGDFSFSSSSSSSLGNDKIYTGSGYYRIKENIKTSGVVIPFTRATNYEIGIAIDMSKMTNITGAAPTNMICPRILSNDFYKITSYSSTNVVFPEMTKRLILPETFCYTNYCIYVARSLLGGLYLSKKYAKENNSTWIITSSSNDPEIPVKAPEGANVPYYLNKLNISADDLVAILNNMADISSESTRQITLGSTNLAKLTEEQKSIAYQKGWELA